MKKNSIFRLSVSFIGIMLLLSVVDVYAVFPASSKDGSASGLSFPDVTKTPESSPAASVPYPVKQPPVSSVKKPSLTKNKLSKEEIRIIPGETVTRSYSSFPDNMTRRARLINAKTKKPVPKDWVNITVRPIKTVMKDRAGKVLLDNRQKPRTKTLVNLTLKATNQIRQGKYLLLLQDKKGKPLHYIDKRNRKLVKVKPHQVFVVSKAKKSINKQRVKQAQKINPNKSINQMATKAPVGNVLQSVQGMDLTVGEEGISVATDGDAASRPDLIIEHVELTEQRPTLANDFRIRVRVKNIGNSTAAIHFSNKIAYSTYAQYWHPPYNGVWYLAPGESDTKELRPNIGYLKVGNNQQWKFWVDVAGIINSQPYGSVVESNEDNNSYDLNVSIYENEVSANSPDLVGVSCQLDPISAQQHHASVLKVSIKNKGATFVNFPSGSSQLSMQGGGGGYSSSGPPCGSTPIAAGETRLCLLQFKENSQSAGIHNATILIDPQNRVAEVNEQNNSFLCSYTIAQSSAEEINAVIEAEIASRPDLIIEHVGFTKECATMTNDFRIRVRVKNIGNSTAAINFSNKVAYSTYAQYWYPPYNGTWYLAPGESDTKELSPSGYLKAGNNQQWVFWVDVAGIIDRQPYGSVVESNEDNNAYTLYSNVYQSECPTGGSVIKPGRKAITSPDAIRLNIDSIKNKTRLTAPDIDKE